jgi:fatty acid desaturase
MAAVDQPLAAGGRRLSGKGRWSEYTQLSRELRQAGLLERRQGWYVARMAGNLALLAAGLAALVVLGESWWQLLVAAYLAVVATQLTFIGHDAGHRQIFRSRRANDLAGLLHGNLLVGISFGWWVPKHNAHHTNPNDEDLDPDIGIAVLAFTAAQAHNKHGLARLITRSQAWLFFPLLLLEAAHLHLASVKAILKGHGRANLLEALLLGIHLMVYVTVLVVVLTPAQALAFVLVQQGLFGLYLGCAFAPNHKGMPTLTQGDRLDFLRRQVLTSRNVAGSPIIDLVFGGLNYQIEHHLFPTMARPNLRRAQPLVQAFCRDHDLPYTQASLIGSYTQALRHLHTIGAPLRAAA